MKTIKPIIVLAALMLSGVMTQAQDIIESVKEGDLEKVKTLIETGPQQLNIKDESGRSPLFWAVSQNNLEISYYLISKGADVNAADHLLKTPLHIAATNGYKEIVEILIKQDASLEARDDYGRTPLLLCARERGGPGN
ncbi:MAG TPA: ankyrin repeat domain-containing protein [Bacteroidales bacterium]|nr:ankyrin repeat domain-containing protein [Bacteroidales bacterium]